MEKKIIFEILNNHLVNLKQELNDLKNERDKTIGRNSYLDLCEKVDEVGIKIENTKNIISLFENYE